MKEDIGSKWHGGIPNAIFNTSQLTHLSPPSIGAEFIKIQFSLALPYMTFLKPGERLHKRVPGI